MTTDQYVPDPERDTAELIDAFCRRLGESVLDANLLSTDLPGIARRAAELEAAHGDLVVDDPARHNLRMSLVLVAAHELLKGRLGADESVRVLRAAFTEPLAPMVRDATLAMLDNAPDPFAAMVAMSKDRELHAFGAGFAFQRPVDDETEYLLDVRGCFYHDVLERNSATELTPILCAFDANWIDAIEPDRHGFRFDRQTTIGLGGGHCPFRFRRTGT
jgi:hypothetical protein